MAEDLHKLAAEIRQLPTVEKLELAARILRLSPDHRLIARAAVRLAHEELELDSLERGPQ